MGGFLKQTGEFETLTRKSFITQIGAVAKRHMGWWWSSVIQSELAETESTERAKLFGIRLLVYMKMTCMLQSQAML